MVKLINAITGGPMWVHESRLDEYLRAGHALPPEPVREVKDKKQTKK